MLRGVKVLWTLSISVLHEENYFWLVIIFIRLYHINIGTYMYFKTYFKLRMFKHTNYKSLPVRIADKVKSDKEGTKSYIRSSVHIYYKFKNKDKILFSYARVLTQRLGKLAEMAKSKIRVSPWSLSDRFHTIINGSKIHFKFTIEGAYHHTYSYFLLKYTGSSNLIK